MKQFVLLTFVLLTGCNAIAVPPTSPTRVTPPADPPPLIVPPPNPVELTLALGSGDPYAGEGLSLRAIPTKGELFAPAVYSWTFGDGENETTETAFAGHTYQQRGEYPASVSVRDRDGRTADASMLVSVTNRPAPPRDPPPPPQCPPVTLSPSTLPNGTVGTNYNRTITATGGKAPYHFAVSTGTLPAGILLAGNGVLSGAPTAAETATFIISATGTNGCSGARSYTITIAAAPPAPDVFTASMSCTAHATLTQVSCNISGVYGGAPVGSGNVSNVNWDWDDGTTSSSAGPAQTHLYLQPGTWTVIGVMTANTAGGVKTAIASKTVTVPRPSP